VGLESVRGAAHNGGSLDEYKDGTIELACYRSKLSRHP
jgi:hypothetical protein